MHDNDQTNQANDLIEAQIAQSNAEIEEKKEAVARERIDIIKSQGAPRWSNAPPGNGGRAKLPRTPNEIMAEATKAGFEQQIGRKI